MQRSWSSITCGPSGHGLLLLDLLLPKPRIVEPEVHVEVLKVAFAGLVADRAVERVVGQEEFQHGAPAVFSLVALGVHHHAFGHRRVAGDLELGDSSPPPPGRCGSFRRWRAPGGSSSAG